MTVSVIDMNTNQIIRNVYVGSWFFAQCYSEVADKYYCDGAQGVAVIDGATDSVIKQIRLPQGYSPTAMVSVESESLVMVAAYSGGADSVFMVDVRSDSIRSALRCGSSPRVLKYSFASNMVYCANSGWDDLSVISADGSRVVGLVPVSDYPQDLLVCPQFAKLYVGHGGETNMLYIVRDRLGIAEAGPSPTHLARATATMVQRTYDHHGSARTVVLDASGRRVAVLKPGDNDLSRLPAGVYLVVEPGQARPRKVVKME
jgi:DNA-binding beta-propeller fold protein YncE